LNPIGIANSTKHPKEQQTAAIEGERLSDRLAFRVRQSVAHQVGCHRTRSFDCSRQNIDSLRQLRVEPSDAMSYGIPPEDMLSHALG